MTITAPTYRALVLAVNELGRGKTRAYLKRVKGMWAWRECNNG